MPGTENVLIWEVRFSKRRIQGKNPVTRKGLAERIEGSVLPWSVTNHMQKRNSIVIVLVPEVARRSFGGSL